MKKSGFTLVEMLIVVVIIGILSSALLPKLTGYMARTRDLKRQADLRNIAAAIEMYRNDHGEFPKRSFSTEGITNQSVIKAGLNMGGASQLSDALKAYLKAIPTDPNKKQSLDGIYEYASTIPAYRPLFMPGEYFYQTRITDPSLTYGEAFLIAKVETPEYTNFISPKIWMGTTYQYLKREILSYIYKDKPLCTSVNKSNSPTMNVKDDGGVECTYSSEDQLYYVVKIE